MKSEEKVVAEDVRFLFLWVPYHVSPDALLLLIDWGRTSLQDNESIINSVS
jgi:hypothetical protein